MTPDRIEELREFIAGGRDKGMPDASGLLMPPLDLGELHEMLEAVAVKPKMEAALRDAEDALKAVAEFAQAMVKAQIADKKAHEKD